MSSFGSQNWGLHRSTSFVQSIPKYFFISILTTGSHNVLHCNDIYNKYDSIFSASWSKTMDKSVCSTSTLKHSCWVPALA